MASSGGALVTRLRGFDATVRGKAAQPNVERLQRTVMRAVVVRPSVILRSASARPNFHTTESDHA